MHDAGSESSTSSLSVDVALASRHLQQILGAEQARAVIESRDGFIQVLEASESTRRDDTPGDDRFVVGIAVSTISNCAPSTRERALSAENRRDQHARVAVCE